MCIRDRSEVKRENIGFTEDGRPAFYSTSGYIIMFQKDKALYKACNRSPDGKQCNKKVQDQNNGYYRCEKCNTEIEGFQWRLILSFSLGDPTDNQWVTCFQEEGEQILGVKSEELGSMFENDEAGYNKVFTDATFKRFNFRLSVKPENYNDEQRLRHTVRSVAKIDWAEHSQRLIKELQADGIDVPPKCL